MSDLNSMEGHQARERFNRVRRKAFLQELLTLVRGHSPDLLSFDAVQETLKAWQQVEHRQPEMIPLDKIVGSVGRYRDFTREFLPKATVNEYRWRSVDVAMHGPTGLPPIEVYQVGDAYFVRDGNHRVSVARANGLTDIEAYVAHIDTPVAITKDTQPEELCLMAAYVDFLRRSHLAAIRPDADLEVTEIGSYMELLQHIEVHRHYLGLEQQREVPYEEAVASWYDRVYLPVAAAIWASDIMDEFPNRTAADLYLWVCRYREEIVKARGTLLSPVAAVTDLAETSTESDKTSAKVVKSVKQALGPRKKDVDLAFEATHADQKTDPGDETTAESSAS